MKCDIFAETPYICFSLFIILTIKKILLFKPSILTSQFIKMVQGNSNQVASYHEQDKSITSNPSQQYHAFILSLVERMDVSAAVIKAFQFIMEMFFKLKNHQFIPVTNLLSQKQCEVLDLAHDLVKLSQYDMALQLLRKNKVLVDVAMENSMYDCNESCEKIIDGVLQNFSYSKEPDLVPKGAVSVACPEVLCNHQVHLESPTHNS